MKTAAERALDLAEEYRVASDHRSPAWGWSSDAQFPSREPAAIAAEWAEAMREVLTSGPHAP